MADLKISQFADGGTIQDTDSVAAVRAGINTKVVVGTMAAEDAGDYIPTASIGTDIGDIVQLESVGGNAALPAVDGSQITGVKIGASLTDDAPGYLDDKIETDNSLTSTLQTPSDNDETLLLAVRRLFATPVSVGTGTHTADIDDGDFHTITATGAFTLTAAMENGQAIMVRAIDFDAYTVTMSSIDFGDAGEPDWTDKDDFIVYRDGNGNYIGLTVVTGLS